MTVNRPFVVLAAFCMVGLLSSQAARAFDDRSFRFDTTSNLYEVCAVAEDSVAYPLANQACRAFIEASVQYHDEISARKPLKPLICYPKAATIEDGKLAFIAWANKHSKDRKLMGEQPVVGLVRALATKYPCAR